MMITAPKIVCFESYLSKWELPVQNWGKQSVSDSVIRSLAIVRCGDRSLHESWSVGRRSFDLGISYFGDDPQKNFPGAQFVHRAEGGKWDGLWAFFHEFPNVLNDYSFFWLPDDDIVADHVSIQRLIEIADQFGLHLCQPALDANSYYSHLITVQHRSFDIRYTNFVETMVPLFSQSLLKKALPMFRETRSGFGLDHLWPQMVTEISDGSLSGVAIIDSVTVCHTRPVGGSLHKMISKEGGPSTFDEMTKAMAGVKGPRKAMINGIPVNRIRVRSADARSGRRISSLSLFRLIILNMLFPNANKVQPVRRWSALKHALKALPIYGG